MPNIDDSHKTITIAQEAHNQRLDQAIVPLFPEMGVRGRRRLWEHNLVTVNGRPRPCGFCVSAGDVVTVQEKQAYTVSSTAQTTQNNMIQDINIIHVDKNIGLASVYKPSGLHSAAIAGSPLPSVEKVLPSLNLAPSNSSISGHFPKLLNRLDGPTSGMLLLALDEAGLAVWNEAEELGTIEKIYFAVAHGTIEKEDTVKTALNTANRQVTTILDHETTDTLRHTEVKPLAVFDMNIQKTCDEDSCQASPVTLVQCRIHKGARHQIRAHMASIGHPLLGDTVYGGVAAVDMPAQLFLHHGRIHIADFTAFCLPPWFSLLFHEGQEKIVYCMRKVYN